MKSLITGTIVVLASAAAAYAAEAPAGSCQALVEQGSCVYASALQGGDGDRLGTLSQIEGRVMASGETGFTPAKADTSLMIGDRILVLEGGKAVLQAGPSYTQALASPAVIDVSAQGNCGCLTVQSDVRTFAQAAGAAGAAGALSGGGTGAGAAGAGAAAAGAGASGAAAGAGALSGIAAATGLSTTAIAVGGAVAVGAVAIGTTVAVNESTSDDTPTSP
ncbi:hypothetical protein AB7M35_002822 [Amorphus suaedae]